MQRRLIFIIFVHCQEWHCSGQTDSPSSCMDHALLTVAILSSSLRFLWQFVHQVGLLSTNCKRNFSTEGKALIWRPSKIFACTCLEPLVVR